LKPITLLTTVRGCSVGQIITPVIQTHNKQTDWLGLRVGGHLALSLHSSDELGELSQWRYAMMTAP